jgi:hypothetical protein
MLRYGRSSPRSARSDEGGYVFDTSEVDEHTGSAKVKCPTCGGSGKQAVAGAYLAERGSHVEFK